MKIILIRPCCIGDVVLATATLAALRRAYPDAHITWAVGRWSRAVLDGHPLVDALLDTGDAALPVYRPGDFVRFVRALRAGGYDLAVSLVRSRLMSAAVLLSGIPVRAGLDSNGRGFGYTVKAQVDPLTPRHEAEVYLDVVRALGLNAEGVAATVPVRDADRATVAQRLREAGVGERYMVFNPAGGQNPGMTLASKRYPPARLATLMERLSTKLDAQPVLVAGPGDAPIVDAVQASLRTPAAAFMGELSFGEVAALALGALFYFGNDTGLSHLAAAAGARTAVVFGPTDPARYAPYVPDVLVLWRRFNVKTGVSGGAPVEWTWEKNGIDVDVVERQILAWL